MNWWRSRKVRTRQAILYYTMISGAAPERSRVRPGFDDVPGIKASGVKLAGRQFQIVSIDRHEMSGRLAIVAGEDQVKR